MSSVKSEGSASEKSIPQVPRFSIGYMNSLVDPHEDFYMFAAGSWIRSNPVPKDKSRWGAFGELQEWNLHNLHSILEECARDSRANQSTLEQMIGDFYRSAMDEKKIEERGFNPVSELLHLVENATPGASLARCAARLHSTGVSALFRSYSRADKKNSSIYAFYIDQGGLSLPDREYYLSASFKQLREDYRTHLSKMFGLMGEADETSTKSADWVLSLETELARAARPRAELRDQERNYNKVKWEELEDRFPRLHLTSYLEAREVPKTDYVIVGQPEFMEALDRLLQNELFDKWRIYLRWHILLASAPFLHEKVKQEHFEFFNRRLLGQSEDEPRWKRAVQVIDGSLGEALGQLYVDKYFPPDARRKASVLVNDICSVFRDRLAAIPWMNEETRRHALEKFSRFRVKIGHPEKYRDYSSVKIDPEDFLGNVWRAAEFEAHRQAIRVGQSVDRDEWNMTPPTVNAYFSPTNNEIVFPAGILQPPFFDASMDDAVNYGGIGTVIGHEITHGYDDQGRRFDAEGNLRDWWTAEDAKKFQERAKDVVEVYSAEEPLPGFHVNGELTLGENIADLGGVSLAFEALQRRLAADPSKRKVIDGFTPEQRFFIAYAQLWRSNIKEGELVRRITTDPHAPAPCRATIPASNHPEFHSAFPQQDMRNSRNVAKKRIGVW